MADNASQHRPNDLNFRTSEIRGDPCHLAWQVNKILSLDSALLNSTRPLPARPAGESDSHADDRGSAFVFIER